jgi:hypothetical protein
MILPMVFGSSMKKMINILPPQDGQSKGSTSILGNNGKEIQSPALIADTRGHVSELGNYSIRRGKWKLIEIDTAPSGQRDTSPALYQTPCADFTRKRL